MNAPNPNAGTVGDLFKQADLEGGFETDLVEPGAYNLALKARANKSGGGIVFIEGIVADGPYVGKKVKVCSLVLHGSEGQKSISLQNLVKLGLDLGFLNGLATQVGTAASDNYEPLYQAIASIIDGRTVLAELNQNTFTSKGVQKTDMQVVPGKITLTGAPPLPAIGGAPQVPQVPVPQAAAPPPPQVPAPVAPVAAAPVLQPQPQGIPSPEPVQQPTPQASGAPGAPGVPVVPLIPGTVVVADEPSF